MLCALLILSVLVGHTASHTYVATIAIGVILISGVLVPGLCAHMMSGVARPGNRRSRVGESLCLRVDIRSSLPIPIPSASLGFESDALDNMLAIEPHTKTLHSGLNQIDLVASPMRRGIVSLAALTIGTSFPFGLWRAQRSLADAGTLIVWPRAAAITLPLAAAMSTLPARETARSSGAGHDELAGVRAYRRGDAMRSIHWQQTGRHDRLIVRERAGVEVRACRLFIDTRERAYATPSEFDRAVSIAAGVLDQAQQEGVRVELRAARSVILVTDAMRMAEAFDLLAIVTFDDDPVTASFTSRDQGFVVTTRRGWAEAPRGQGLTPVFADETSGGAHT